MILISLSHAFRCGTTDDIVVSFKLNIFRFDVFCLRGKKSDLQEKKRKNFLRINIIFTCMKNFASILRSRAREQLPISPYQFNLNAYIRRQTLNVDIFVFFFISSIKMKKKRKIKRKTKYCDSIELKFNQYIMVQILFPSNLCVFAKNIYMRTYTCSVIHLLSIVQHHLIRLKRHWNEVGAKPRRFTFCRSYIAQQFR